MQYNDSTGLDTSTTSMGGGGGFSGGGGRGPMFFGGGALGLVLTVGVVIAGLIFGFNPLPIILGQGSGVGPGTSSQQTEQLHCDQSGWSKDINCRLAATMNSLQQYWSPKIQGFQPAQLVIERDGAQWQTGCGAASADTGPFYCPADSQIYVVPTFFEQMLQRQLGAKGGAAAEAYVLAHEYGHHISHLTGQLRQSRDTGPRSDGVRSELQADCYAGVWMASAAQQEGGLITSITKADLDVAVDAARAVGDDSIQSRSGGVDPDSWTHGSAEMRKHWLTTGFTTGDPNRCDTFAADATLQ